MLSKVNKHFKHIYSTFRTEHISGNTSIFNPITAPAIKISGLKDAGTSLQTVSFLAVYHIYFQCYVC